MTKSTGLVDQLITIDFEITTNNIIEKDAEILITIPAEQAILASNEIIPDCRPYSGNVLQTNLISCVLLKNSLLDFQLLVKEFCSLTQTYCIAGTKLKFRVSKLKNPFSIPIIIPSISITLQTKDAKFLIEERKNGISSTPVLAASDLTNVNFAISEFKTTSLTLMTFRFTLPSTVTIDSYFLITFSTGFARKDPYIATTLCYSSINNVKTLIACVIKIDNNQLISSIRFNSPCSSGCSISSNFLLELTVLNRLSTSPHAGNVKIEVFSKDNYLISQGSFDLTTLSPLITFPIIIQNFFVTK